MIDFRISPLWVGLVVLVCLAQPTLAFGAGNIGSLSKVEGINWRHGDIEDALLNIAMARAWNGKKFDKLAVSRIYFGNWLRDYSQAVDVGTVKSVSAEAIRLVLSILGFLTFGFGSKEFEVTSERLGCYRPEEHIDNPKDYAENEDARQYDRRLRGPIDERRELSVDEELGMKSYIASERAGIQTSAQLLRELFGKCIELGRNYSRSKRSEDLYEALRLMGTGLHCLEDFFAHSNYTELALIEMGINDIFPHVGRDTQINLQGARNRVYPLVTGTFGGVDFLHSVTGEVSDKLKQNELQELESTLQESKKNDTSMLRNLLDKIPDSFFGGKHQSDKLDEIQQNCANSQMQNMSVSPKEPEEFTRYVQGIFKDIMPVIEWHDEVMKALSAAFDKIPILPQIIEQLEEQLTKFIFTQIAPFILPVVQQIQNEMATGSEQIVESSEREQHIVFNNDRSTDPTHSMLSKDHFTNLLNEPAGRTASEMIQWVVPQLMNAIDDENVDVNRTLTRIIYGVFHHPAHRNQGNDGAQEGRQLIFRSIENWWNGMGRQQQDDYRRKLSRDGVKNGENHKEGEYDTGHGHGCLGSLHMHKQFGKGEPKTWEDKIANKAAGAILEGATGAFSGIIQQTTGVKVPSYQQPEQKESRKDDGPGGLLGAASSLLGGFLGGGKEEKEEQRPSSSSNYGRQDSSHSGGGYQQQQQQSNYGGSQQSYGGSSQQSYGGNTQQSFGGQQSYGGSQTSYGGSQQSYGGRQEEHSGYGGRRDDNRRDDNRRDDNRRDDNYGGGAGGYGSSQQSYGGRQEEHSGRRRDDDDNRRNESSGYGGSGGYGGSQQSYGGRQEEHSRYGGGGRREESGGYGGQQSYGGGRRDDDNDRHGSGRRRDDDDDDDDHHGRHGGGRRDDRRDDDNHGRRW